MTTKYMCLLRSGSGDCEKPSASEMEAKLKRYQAWQEKFAEQILDMGARLTGEGAVVSKDVVKDGPYMETKEVVGGYMVLTANSLQEALEVIENSPMVEAANVSVEVREMATQ